MKISPKKIILIVTLLLISSLCFADSKYKVNKGDTLYSISKKYQITVAELRAANNLSEKDVIKVGQVLIIPTANLNNAVSLNSDPVKTDASKNKATKTYVVQKGDTLYGISKKSGMSVGELMALNNFDNNTVIKVGQKVKVYETGSAVKTSTTTASGTTATQVTSNPPDTRTYGSTVNADSSTVWPVKNPKVTTVKGKVNGVQLSAGKDETVTCIREGSVMYVGVYRGYGQILFIQSKTGIIYAYAGLGSINVKKGDYAMFGTSLGTVGIDPISKKSQITLMVFQNGQPIDPAKAPRS